MLIFSVFQCSSKLILQLFEFLHLLKLENTRLDLPESLPPKKESSLRYVNNFYLNCIYIYIYMTSLEIYASSLFRNLKWSSLSSDWSQISQYNNLNLFLFLILFDFKFWIIESLAKKKGNFQFL